MENKEPEPNPRPAKSAQAAFSSNTGCGFSGETGNRNPIPEGPGDHSSPTRIRGKNIDTQRRHAGAYLDFIRSQDINRLPLLRTLSMEKTASVSLLALCGPVASVLFRPIRETASSRKSEGIPDRQPGTHIKTPGTFHRLIDLPLPGASGAANLSVTSLNSIKKDIMKHTGAPSRRQSCHLIIQNR